MQGNASDAKRPMLHIGRHRATLKTSDRLLATFRVRRVDALSRASAEKVIANVSRIDEPLLVAFRTASPDALVLLREQEVSYAGDDGESFLFAPPVYIERMPRRSSPTAPPRVRSPFAPRASRVARWLLLHLEAQPSLTGLARFVELSEATVSRTAHALAGDGLAELTVDPGDTRVRRLRARNTAGLLDSLERSSWSTRARRQTWDVGARDFSDALKRWRDATEGFDMPYAVGGLAGAATLRRVVEPAEVLVWLRREDLMRWSDRLMAEPARPARGRVTVQLAPDPFVLTLASDDDGLKIADPVQLYLDCRLAGERALEGAEAIREMMRW
jgi:hypothetical protein